MPPRFAYWTIILDQAPTSFRTKEREEILPLYNQLKAKNPTVELKWFSGGKLWDSPEQAREERERAKVRAFRDERTREAKAQREGAEDPLAEFRKQHGRPADGSDQKPPQNVDRGRAASVPRGDRPRSDRLWSDQPRSDRPWSDAPRPAKAQREGGEDPLAEFRKQHGRPADGSDQQRPDVPGRGPAFPPGREGRPPSDRRNKDWRPGGDHRDPRDKYKLPPGEARKRWKERNLGGPGGPRKPYGDRKPFGSRPPGDRPFSDRPPGDRPAGGPPRGDRPWSGKPRGLKPPGSTRNGGRGFSLDGPAKPRGDRPFGDRPFKPKPYGSKPGGPGGARKPYGSKPGGPRKPFGERPKGPGGPRGPRGKK